MKFEIEIIKWLQSFSSPFLDGFFKFVANCFDYPLVIFLALVLLIFKRYRETILFLIIEGVGFAVQVTMKAIINRPRPHVASSEVLNIFEASNSSFPSGHSITCMGGVAILFFIVLNSSISKKKKIWCYVGLGVMLILCALDRMYLGQHYISDVLAGFIISAVIAALVFCVYLKTFRKTNKVEN